MNVKNMEENAFGQMMPIESKHKIPKGVTNGLWEIGFIDYCTIPEFGEDKFCNHDLFLMTLPENEHLEIQYKNGYYLVNWSKSDWNGLYESKKYRTLKNACRGLFSALYRAIQLDCKRKHKDAN